MRQEDNQIHATTYHPRGIKREYKPSRGNGGGLTDVQEISAFCGNDNCLNHDQTASDKLTQDNQH